MRLIDATELVRELLEWISKIQDPKQGLIALAVVEKIKSAPTIEPPTGYKRIDGGWEYGGVPEEKQNKWYAEGYEQGKYDATIEPSGDLISRADAVKELKKAYWDKGMQSAKDDPCVIDAMTDWAIRTIKALPSADRPMGEWEHKPSKSGEWIWWQCSECGAVIYSESEADRKKHHAYCGVCGARMKGGE